jgi:hypothetical protein
MGRTAEKLSAVALVVAVVVGLMAIAFGIGYLVGKILL